MNKEQKTYRITMCSHFTYEHKVKANDEDSAIEKARECITYNRTNEDVTIVEENQLEDVYCLNCEED